MKVNEMSPISTLALLNSNKAQRRSFCLQVIEQLENGNADPLQIHVFLKNLEQIFKTFTDEKVGKDLAARYRTALMFAVDTEPGNQFEKYNAKFQVKETGVKYDETVCNDPVITKLLQEQEHIDNEVKERMEFLKTIPEGGLVVTDQETGETTTIYKPAKSSTTTVSVTLS